MALIYEPKGRAREYAALACNVYVGCDHQCVYCYAPRCLHVPAASFAQPRVRSANFLRDLEREAERLTPTERILLCFTCDPYQAFDVEAQVTRQAIQALHRHGHAVQVLTKGGKRALRDLDLFTDKDAFATTLTFIDPVMITRYEPGAAPTLDRLKTIAQFHTAGVETWVSLEPVFSPDDALDLIRQSHEIVDLYKVGKLNYHPLAKEIDWAKFARDATELLQSLDKQYYLKDDLRAYMG